MVTCALLSLALGATLGLSHALAVKKPHVIVVIADDFGWHNIGWRNPEVSTPHLDALAADGIKLDRHYTFKYCSPTRSSLLTGRLPLHVNQNNECNKVHSRSGADLRMTLLPAKLKTAGYKTAMTGKWHCGARSPANLPINRGFDSHYGFLRGGEDHCTQRLSDGGFSLVDLWANHTPAHGRNGTRGCEAATFSATQYGQEAVRIVREHDARDPLFMYLPFQVSHSPYQIPPGFVNASVAKPRQVVFGMIHMMDTAVGNLTAALKANDNMYDDTLIIFSADNGGVYHGNQKTNNWPLRGQKTSSWEGGVRASAFVWGGANVLTDSSLRGTTNAAFIHVSDWYATILNRVGVDPTDDKHKHEGVPSIDSIDQWDTLMTREATPAHSTRREVPLAFCPPDSPGTDHGSRGSDDCAPTDHHYKVMSTVEWQSAGAMPRNAALIQITAAGMAYKLVWGRQFGFGVRSSPNYPNGTRMPSDDKGCPSGCLFELTSDPGEYKDLSTSPSTKPIFDKMVQRLLTIGATQWQTNYSDVGHDADCITDAQMNKRYGGWLGPVCGLASTAPGISPEIY